MNMYRHFTWASAQYVSSCGAPSYPPSDVSVTLFANINSRPIQKKPPATRICNTADAAPPFLTDTFVIKERRYPPIRRRQCLHASETRFALSLIFLTRCRIFVQMSSFLSSYFRVVIFFFLRHRSFFPQRSLYLLQGRCLHMVTSTEISNFSNTTIINFVILYLSDRSLPDV